jgi:hypothetical protein
MTLLSWCQGTVRISHWNPASIRYIFHPTLMKQNDYLKRIATARSTKSSRTSQDACAQVDRMEKSTGSWSPEVPRAKPTLTPTAAEARAAIRRSGWKIVVADSFAEAEAETRAYWSAATPAERLNALEKLREPFYGKDQIGGRLQRFLEVVPAE